MWRQRLWRAVDWLRSRQLVGQDAHHLYYEEFVGNGERARRLAFSKRGGGTPVEVVTTAQDMEVAWWAWLHHRRPTVPSDDEVRQAAAARERLAERVARLRVQEERERLRFVAGVRAGRDDDSGHGGGDGHGEHNGMQLTDKRKRKAFQRLHDAAVAPVLTPVGGKGGGSGARVGIAVALTDDAVTGGKKHNVSTEETVSSPTLYSLASHLSLIFISQKMRPVSLHARLTTGDAKRRNGACA